MTIRFPKIMLTKRRFLHPGDAEPIIGHWQSLPSLVDSGISGIIFINCVCQRIFFSQIIPFHASHQVIANVRFKVKYSEISIFFEYSWSSGNCQ